MQLDIFFPSTHPEYQYIYSAVAVFLVLIIFYYLTVHRVNQKNRTKSTNEQKDNFKDGWNNNTSKIYVAQTDRNINNEQRREFADFGPLITVVESKKNKHILGGIFLLFFASFLIYAFSATYQAANPAAGSNTLLSVLLSVAAVIISIYYSLFNLHQSTYSIRLYKKGFMIRSLLKTKSYYYDSIKEIRTYEYRRKGLFPNSRSILGTLPTWVCELSLNDNTVLSLDTKRYNSDLYNKMTRWEKSLKLD